MRAKMGRIGEYILICQAPTVFSDWLMWLSSLCDFGLWNNAEWYWTQRLILSCVWPVCQKNPKNKISTGTNGPLLQWNIPANDGANRLPTNLTSVGPKIHLHGSISVYGCRSDRGCLTEGEIKLSSRSCHVMEVSLGGRARSVFPTDTCWGLWARPVDAA